MSRGTWNRVAVVTVVLFAVTAHLPAAVLTWTGNGDGTSWNNAANWDLNQAPVYTDTLNITTSATIANVYRDTGTSLYSDGYTWRGVVSLNEGTVNLPSYFGTGSSGVFNIGDGTLTGGVRDAVVNVGGTWQFDRHDNGTFTLNILRDGALYGGTFTGFDGHPNRKYVINVDGGLMASSSAWNMGADTTDTNQVSISNHGSVTVGALTIDSNDVIDLQDRTALFTAGYGGSFADLAAVEAAVGSRFVSGGGVALRSADNGDGTFSVGSLLPPTGRTLPGGFLANSLQSGLLYHLDAAAGVATDGTAVTAWADQGAAGNDFAQADTNKQPVYQAGGFGGNNLPSVQFDGVVDYAQADQLVLDESTSAQTIVIVNSIEARTSTGGIIGHYNSDYGIRESGTGWYDIGNGNDFANPAGSEFYVNGEATGNVGVQTPHIVSAVRASAMTWAATGLGNYFYNSVHAARPYRGDIAEVLVFDRALNTAELRILENSLSAKYDIGLAEHDYYAGDTAANGDYDLDVVGIGRADSENFVYRAGDAGFGMAAYNLDDGDWLMAGHASPGNDWVVGDLPADGKSRWGRVWCVDETGDLDSATFVFDYADAGLTEAGAGQPLGLLYRESGAMDFSIIAQNPTIVDGTVIFDLAGAQIQDGYYTLGVIPEPSTWMLAAVALLVLTVRRRWS